MHSQDQHRQPLWERACPRWRRVSHRMLGLIYRYREHAGSHI